MKLLSVILVVCLVCCAAYAEDVKPAKAIVALGLSQTVYGNITFSQASCHEAVFIEIKVGGLTPGKHGFHVHDKGDLTGGCLSTGGHFNPDKLPHGAREDSVRHVGDLGNIVADANGIAETSFSDNVITLYGHRSILGRAVVVHTTEDDLGKTNHPDSSKTGNAGGRVACGIIGILESSEGVSPCSGSSRLTFASIALTIITVLNFLL